MITKSRNNLGKREIANNIKTSIGLSLINTQKITDDIITIIVDILVSEKKINLKNFGTFKIIHKKQREGRNPKTKEGFIISERKTIKFKSSNFLKRKINEI